MFDLIVIGAGPGGYNAAIYAAKRGLKVALIEKSELGGVCLNSGCIPTKFLLHSAELSLKIKNCWDFGIIADYRGIDVNRLVERSREVVQKLNKGISYLLSSHKVEVIHGIATILHTDDNSTKISCNNQTFQSKNVLIATGSTPRVLPGLPFSPRVWSSQDALAPKILPKKMAIIGAGAIGIEFAWFYAALGVAVHVYELAPRILPLVDSECAEVLKKQMESMGVTFSLGAQIQATDCGDSVNITTQEVLEKFDVAIVAIGTTPNVEQFSEILQLERGYIKTNAIHETSKKSIYAIGDCTAPPWLAHKATHEGLRVIRAICDEKLPAMPPVPMCIYTTPQIASIGATEEELQSQDRLYKVKKANFAANGKAVALDEGTGFVKTLLCAKTGEILGVHIVGPAASELIHSAIVAIAGELIPDSFADIIPAHPTLSELWFEELQK